MQILFEGLDVASTEVAVGTCQWIVLEIFPLGWWEIWFTGRYFAGGSPCWNKLKWVLGEAAGYCGSLSSVKSQPLEVFTLQEQGRACWEHTVSGKKSPFFLLILQCHLLTKLNIVPTGKRKIFYGPSSTSTEHAKRVNIRMLKFVVASTVHSFGYSASTCILLRVLNLQ